ncbi:MAG: hypothetical protein KF914_17775 [Rhizobiaceae bacterium]|nr:hypothetical protein [Rhizobiaceae bacterium]
MSRFAIGFGLGVSALALSGCMSSPTYGTDKTANEQLLGDVTGILSLAPPKKPRVDYKPRPELVTPVKGDAANLPQPQESATVGNPDWPESPEQQRARLRAEADANRDDPNWKPVIDPDLARATSRETREPPGSPRYVFPRSNVDPVRQRAEFNRRLAENRQGSATNRKFLSEPPLDYRQPAATAPVNDIGEDEFKKERRLKAAAAKPKKWADYLPW